MTREQAIARLRECPTCRRWITTPACDTCWANTHRCPSTVEAEVLARLEEASRLIAQTRKTLKAIR